MPTQAAPGPRAGSIGGAPVVGVLMPGEPAALLIAEDLADFAQGYETAAAGGAPRDGTWWFREGWNTAAARRPRLDLVAGYPVPGYQPLTPLTAREVALYRQGWTDGNAGSTVAGPKEWWYKYGRADGRAFRPLLPLVPDVPPPPFPRSVEVPQRLEPGELALQWPVVELVAKIFGKRVPYDRAIALEKLPFEKLAASVLGQLAPIIALGSLIPDFTEFEFVGGGPLDEEEGYGLAGQNGRLARLIRKEADKGALSPNPERYGLPAWVGARLSNGKIRVLSAGELRKLGLFEDLVQFLGLEPAY